MLKRSSKEHAARLPLARQLDRLAHPQLCTQAGEYFVGIQFAFLEREWLVPTRAEYLIEENLKTMTKTDSFFIGLIYFAFQFLPSVLSQT